MGFLLARNVSKWDSTNRQVWVNPGALLTCQLVIYNRIRAGRLSSSQKPGMVIPTALGHDHTHSETFAGAVEQFRLDALSDHHQ